MDTDKTLLQTLMGWIGELLGGARDLLTGEDTRRAIIADLGGKPSSPSAPPQYPPAALSSISAYRDAAQPTLEGFAAAVQDVRTCFEAIRSFADSLQFDDASVVADEVYRDLLDLLATNFVRLRLPRLYFILQVFGFEEEFTSANAGEYGGFTGTAKAVGNFFSFLFSPTEYFDHQNFDDEDSLAGLSDRIAISAIGIQKIGRALAAKAKLKRIERAFKLIGADELVYGWDVVPGVPGSDATAPIEQVLARTLTLKYSPDIDPAAGSLPPPVGTQQQSTLLVTLALLPRTQGGPGLFASLGGGYEYDVVLANPWALSFEFQATGAVSALISKARKFELHAPDDNSDFRAGVALEARPNPVTNTALALDLGDGTGLRIGLLRFEAALSRKAAVIKTAVRDGVIALGPKLFGSFLGQLIPSDGLRLLFDFEAGLASDRGLFFGGRVPLQGSGNTASAPAGGATPASAPARAAAPASPPPPLPPLSGAESTGPGIALRIPIGRSLGPITIHDLQLRIGSEGSGDARTTVLDVASSLSVKLGPVQARADRLGVHLGFKAQSASGAANMGLFDLDVGPKLPQGIGLAIDAKGVLTGGGFLFHDRAADLYAGVMQLSLHERITLKAFGLIATHMPDGSKGYSLIVFITAEDFKPIPLGMGLSLQGIGGMVAIHRTFSETAMREGLRNNTLGTLLFPRDPIRNAPEIIRNLSTVFPAKQGSYLFGILAKIGWFSPTLVTLNLALILEFGSRHRLIVLGRIQALLPSRDNALIQLNLDSLGLIDFDEGKAEIDAVLVDSRLAQKFVLTGSMALRARWTSGPGKGFALAVGGFNPRFVPPAGMPKLDRIAIALSSGDNPRLTCEAYFAITSNTIQFGARAQLYAAAIGFSVEGEVGFDVLIQLVPFHFLAEFHASLQLKRGSRSLFKVKVAAALEGPRPLRISGKASFEILWCDFTVRFDKTLISGQRPPLPPAVDVLSELRRALSDAQSWTTQRDAQVQHGVALRKLPPGAGPLVLDPLGTLTVKQQVVPLNTTRDIETFGGAPVAGARRFQLGATLSGQATQVVAPVKDLFAPAQFFNMSDDEKLASPSFEEMQAGVTFGTDALTFDDARIVASPLTFETIIVDAAGQSTQPKAAEYPLTAQRLSEQVRVSAVGKAALRSSGFARFRNEQAPQAVGIQTPRWMIASLSDTQSRAEGVSADATWSEKRATLAALNRVTTTWQLVPAHEI